MAAITLERLRHAVSVQGRAARPAVRPRVELPPLTEILHGEWMETPEGPTFVRDQWYALDHAHGVYPLGRALDCEAGALEMMLGGREAPPPESYGFFDIETTGLAGGTGTYVVLAALGTFERVAAEEPLAFRLRQYFLAGLEHERAMLALLAEDLARCEALVTYNGRSFDVPVMESRFTLSRISSPCEDFPHFDLLHPMRRLYAHRMPACRLADAERRLLRIERPDDVPGFLIPQIYRDYLVAGRVSPLRGVFRHNAEDVLSLVGILASLSALIGREEHDPDDAIAIARWYERAGDRERAMRLYGEALPWLEGSDEWPWAASRFALLLKREGRRCEAAKIWERLWAKGDWGSGLELAKYLEHNARNLREAERIVVGLAERTELSDLLVSHRLQRIQRKLARY